MNAPEVPPPVRWTWTGLIHQLQTSARLRVDASFAPAAARAGRVVVPVLCAGYHDGDCQEAHEAYERAVYALLPSEWHVSLDFGRPADLGDLPPLRQPSKERRPRDPSGYCYLVITPAGVEVS